MKRRRTEITEITEIEIKGIETEIKTETEETEIQIEREEIETEIGTETETENEGIVTGMRKTETQIKDSAWTFSEMGGLLYFKFLIICMEFVFFLFSNAS